MYKDSLEIKPFKDLPLIVDDELSASNLYRIAEALNRSGFNYLNVYNEELLVEIISKIASFSNYLTDILVRNPEFLTYFLTDVGINEIYSLEKYSNFCRNTINIFKTSEKKANALRRLKRREFFRIALKDLFEQNSTRDLMKEYSFLAIALLDCAFSIALDEAKEHFKIKNIENKYCLIGLGKLGGLELNYSSDVDLLCIYENDKKIKRDLYPAEFFEFAIKKFIELVSANTSEGYLFRVDFRLRPEGKGAPLCRSFANTLFYYETKGSHWERQMLLRANFVSGDYKLYSDFHKGIKNFIFHSLNFESPVEIIKKFKSNYKELIDNKYNVKFTNGGIRDIEFSIQILQLIFGGHYPNLRVQNTIDTIYELKKQKILKENEAKTLEKNYLFLRKVENYLQMFNDQQVHIISQNQEIVNRLARYCNYTTEQFFEKYFYVLENTSKCLHTILGNNKIASKKDVKINFADLKKAQNNLFIIEQSLNGVTWFSAFGKKEDLIEKVFYNIKIAISKTGNPDKVLENLTKMFTNSNINQVLTQLINEIFFNAFIKIAEYSELMSNDFSYNKRIQDFFISGGCFRNIESFMIFFKYDVEEFKLLRFYLIFNFIEKRIDEKIIAQQLKSFYSRMIQVKMEKLTTQYKINSKNICVLSLGSFASGEMNFSSDIDLLFIYSDKKSNNTLKYQKLFTVLLNELTFENPELKIDIRLRPEGKSSQIAFEIDEFFKYINTRARIWEFQSYTKLDFVAGNYETFSKIKEQISLSLCKYDYSFIISEVKENLKSVKRNFLKMKTDSVNLKYDDGGIIDIQFLEQLIHLLQIKLSIQENKGLTKKEVKLKKLLLKLNKVVIQKLNNSLIKFRYLILIIYVLQNRQKQLILKDDLSDLRYKKFLKFPDNHTLIDYINQFLKSNKKIVDDSLKLIEKVTNGID